MPASKPAHSDEVFDASSMLDEIKSGAKRFKMPNGEEFVLPAPTAWPDEAFVAANGNDPITASRLILGDEEYARYVSAGGNALFLQQLVATLHGASVGESSASSSS